MCFSSSNEMQQSLVTSHVWNGSFQALEEPDETAFLAALGQQEA